jgi:hypothetical protein
MKHSANENVKKQEKMWKKWKEICIGNGLRRKTPISRFCMVCTKLERERFFV